MPNETNIEASGLKEALAFAVAQQEKSQTLKDAPGGKKYAILDNSQKVHTFDPISPILDHVKQRLNVDDAVTFNAYFNKFKKINSEVFADYDAAVAFGVIDYHAPGDNANKPDYLDHVVVFDVPYSEQWERWRGIDNQKIPQKAFAEFIEENYMDISMPTHADMLSVVQTLEAKKDVSFASAITLQNGDVQFTYAENTEAKGRGNFAIPKEFKLNVPVFNGGAPVEVRCLLRYGIDEGRLSFTIKVNRRKFIEREAFAVIVKEIASATTTVPFMGKPKNLTV